MNAAGNITSTTRFRVRPARESDIPVLCDLLDELCAVETDFRSERLNQRRGLSILLKAGEDKARILVAEQRGEVVAMATCQVLISTAEGGHVGLVEDVVVRKNRRGLGIGSELLEALEGWAVLSGLKRLQLHADGENTAALDFYEKKGWQPTSLVSRRKLTSGMHTKHK